MVFTYNSYAQLLSTIEEKGYIITDYHDYKDKERPCILRHDIDYSMEKAIELAEFETNLNVRSTWFVLVSGAFYNVFSSEVREQIAELIAMGHEIGLHFDETVYEKCNDFYQDYMIDKILMEKNLLESVTGVDVSVVSMHRPSKRMLNENLKVPGMINSYSKEFFDNFKYVSDSRRRWREDVKKIVNSMSYEKLHILTHAFWYNEKELSLKETLFRYLDNSKYRIWDLLNNNFTELESVIKKEEI